MAKILLRQNDEPEREIVLSGADMMVGRNYDCGILLNPNDAKISRHHAHIFFANGAWRIEDLNSSNGTKVNGNKITTALLNQDDLISIGDALLIFKDENATPTMAVKIPTVAETTGDAALSLSATADDLKLVEQMRQSTEVIRREVAKVIIGQEDVLNQILMCIIAGGHALLIGLPGLAKTLTVSTIAKVLDMKFKRIQFTPDLMPSDITGTEVLETDRVTQQKEFRFMPGPIFCNILLADEINRTPPKTQAALLEAMQEKCVSIGKDTHRLDRPFFVLATQNPIEQEGTYPLPEAQLDRFMFNVYVDYPSREAEEAIVAKTTVHATTEPQVVLGKTDIITLQEVVRKIPVSQHVVGYVINLVRATRPTDPEAPDFVKKYVSTGAGPRAGQYLVLAAKARAVLEGRIHVSCNDIRSAALPVLRHRVLTNFTADSEGVNSRKIVEQLLAEIKEPGPEIYQKA
jgi:MoxR-like ATPase